MPSPPLRYSFVSASFLMYFRGSYVMCYWVVNWRKRHPEGHILGRPLLAFVLILVFGIYGLVYVGRLHGIVSCRAERIFYQTLGADCFGRRFHRKPMRVSSAYKKHK